MASHREVATVVLIILIPCLAQQFSEGDTQLQESSPPAPSPLDNPWSTNVNVSDDLSLWSQVEPTLAVDSNGKIHAGWIDWRSGLWRVRYGYSEDGGLTFKRSVEMQDTTHPETGDPVLAIDDADIIYYAWISFDRFANTGDVVMRKSYDGGTTWGPLIKVSDSPETILSDKPWIVTDGDDVFAVWADYNSGFVDIRFARALGGNNSFEPSVRVNDVSGFSGRNGACVAVGPNREIYVTWWDGRLDEGIYFAKSTDLGRTFGPNKKIAGTPWSPSVAPYRVSAITGMSVGPDGSIHVIWTNFSNSTDWDIYYSRSIDGGETFSPPLRVNSDDSGKGQFMPWIDVDGAGIVHTVWYDNRTGRLEIYYANSTDGGLTFNSNVRVSDTSFVGENFIGDYIPIVADQKTDLHVVWCDSRNGNNDIYYSRMKGVGLPGSPPGPPSNVTARLTGLANRDVNITWSLSSDDGGGQNSVTHYSVYEGQFYDPNGTGYSWLADVPSGRGFYIDQGAGEGDSSNHFYVIVANDVWDQSSMSETQAAKFTRFLSEGWHLVSFPLLMEEHNISALGTLKFDQIRHYNGSRRARKWEFFMSFKSLNDFIKVNEKIALWVHVTKVSNLTIAGQVPKNVSIDLKKGWNFVGFPSFNYSYTISRLTNQTKAMRVESELPFSPFYLNSLPPSDKMKAGWGYWIKVPAKVTWVLHS